jgi:hypothetical protein
MEGYWHSRKIEGIVLRIRTAPGNLGHIAPN